ncbi:MAG: T9SS type A sorting domain-containing protein, partial [Bacteroidota bacterium]
SVNATTTYYIEVFSPQTGCLTIDSVTVFYEDEPLPIINMVDPPPTCAGSDVLIPCPVSGPPGTTFTWFGPGNYSNTTCEILLENVNADNAGIYTLVVTNQAGCEVSGSFELVVEELANSIFTTPPLPCADESFTVNLNNTDPSYTYAWSPAALFNDPSVANPTATLTEDATIEVVIVDATTGCELTLSQFIDVDEDCLWPGDTDTSGVVNNFDLLNVGLGYGTSGPQRPDSITTWVGHGAPAWPQSTSAGVNYKHLDCDANGLIDIADTLIINAHWGLTHNLLTDPDQSQWVDDRDMAAPFFVLPDSLEPNATYSLPIILGNEDFPAEDVYGLAFSIIYDPEVIVSGSPNLNVDGSWLGDWGTDLFSIQKNFHAQGRLDLAMTRIDGQGQSGSGEIGRFNIIVEDIIFLGAGNQDRDGNLKTTFEIKDVLVINAEGEVIEVDLPPSEFEIVSSTRAVILPEIPVQITPNPTGGDVLISSPENQIQDIRIWNTLGHPVLSRLSIASTSEQLSLGHLPAGIYWVEVRTEDGIGRQRLVIE